MRITRDAINRLPEVKKSIQEKRTEHAGVKRKLTAKNEAAKRLVKQMRRNVFTGDQRIKNNQGRRIGRLEGGQVEGR